MTFANTDYLYLLAVIPAMALFGAWMILRRRAAVSRLGDPDLIARLSAGVDWRSRRARNALWIIALALAAVAFARPQWGSEIQVLERQGVQLVIALDISQSMLAEDVKPSRLERAKLEVNSLLERLDGDEVGLVLFSGAAFLQFPLTFDYAAARTYIDNARPGLISLPGTAIGEAIESAMPAFDETRPGQKVIIIMTDGENHEGDPMAAVEEARREGAVIYTVGFGSGAGEPIPAMDSWGRQEGYKRDRAGNVAISRLDEATLREIAGAGGGRYYRAAASGAMQALAAELDALQQESVEAEFETRNIERFQVFLALAALLLIAIELLPDRVGPWLARRRKEAA